MVSDEKSLRAAYERIEYFLEHPPHEGTPQSAEFTILLEEVAQFQSEQHAHHVGVVAVAAEAARDLVRKAADLLRRDVDRTHQWTNFPEDGAGIGPTTGV